MRAMPEGHQDALRGFQESFGRPPSLLSWAPGRINLIGEHTDYHDGYCMPAAIDAWIFVAAAPTTGPCRVTSSLNGQTAAFDLKELDRGRVEPWARYPAGVAWALQERARVALTPVDAFVHSTLRTGSGLSSSAAFEMGFGTLWRRLDRLPVTDADLALAGQRAENEFVGMNCGIMDQTASLLGRAGCALFLDTADPGRPEPVPLPPGLSIVVCDTTAHHVLTGSGYNARRSESESAARKLRVSRLRQTDLTALEAAQGDLTPDEVRRARHVLTENDRVLAFRRALEEDDEEALGRLMSASHVSLRDDYAVSCGELDAMWDAARALPDCVGVKMTGGGFGGACVALVRSGAEPDFMADCQAAFRAKTGLDGEFRVCRAVDGASAISL